MSLGLRFLLAISLLVALISVGLSFAVRRAWHSAEQQQFEQQFEVATERLRAQLEREVADLPAKLGPLCAHGEMVNSALVDLEAGRGRVPTDREYPLSALATETQKTFGFDEFVMFTNTGKVLGAHDTALVGSTQPSLALLRASSERARLETHAGQTQLGAHCVKLSGGFGVGLRATRRFASILEQVASTQGLHLALTRSQDPATRVFTLSQLPGTEIFAWPKRDAFNAAITELNGTILRWGAGTLALSLLLGFLFARRLAEPMEALSKQAGLLLTGEPKPIEARGGKELKQFAESFNRALRDLSELRRRLAASERIAAQREIARRVAHEIKNPLAPIRAAMETLRRLRRRNDPAFEAYFDEASQTVLEEVTRIANIVNEFTRFARLPPPNPQEVELGGIIRSAVGLHRGEATPIDVDCDAPVVLRADKDQLMQVITNLLQNALDAVREQPDGRVWVSACEQWDDPAAPGDAERAWVRLSIEDNGPGIPVEVSARLFSPYVTSKPGGTGLGLSIVQHIVVEHGGAIDSEDRPAGTRFVVRLPVTGPVLAPDSRTAAL
ncbi:MAG: hypothetical protein RJA70_317 [Pseudomonadota bacterium]|jgi:signal transduction histidine kinase